MSARRSCYAGDVSFFSSDAFLSCAARAYFPDGDVRPGWVRVDGADYRVLVDGRGRPQVDLPFLDVLEPGQADQAARPVRRLPRVDRGHFSAALYRAGDFRDRTVAPYVDWSGFDDFSAFEAYAKSHSHFAFRQKRKRRALEKQFGAAVTFLAHDPRPGLLERCFAWKSAQYVESGFVDVMQGAAPQLFRALYDEGALLVSSLCAGEALLAVHLGVRHAGVFYYWVPAYDPDLRKHSPGTLLIEDMMQASYEAGDGVFDFLEGNEPYKFTYATHVRFIGTAGPVSIPGAVGQHVRRWGKALLAKTAPALTERLRTEKRKWEQRRVV